MGTGGLRRPGELWGRSWCSMRCPFPAGVAFPHPYSLLGPGTQDDSTGHSASRETTLHVPSPTPAGCPLLPGWSYVTINHKSLSDATSESAQGPCPWDPLGPLSMGLSWEWPSLPRQPQGCWAGPVVPLVCCVSPEPEQNVTMDTNRVGAAVLIHSLCCT